MKIERVLENTANEIRDQGILGWGNVCADAASHIRKLESVNANLYEALERIRYECDNDLSGRAKLFIDDVLTKARGEEQQR